MHAIAVRAQPHKFKIFRNHIPTATDTNVVKRHSNMWVKGRLPNDSKSLWGAGRPLEFCTNLVTQSPPKQTDCIQQRMILDILGIIPALCCATLPHSPLHSQLCFTLSASTIGACILVMVPPTDSRAGRRAQAEPCSSWIILRGGSAHAARATAGAVPAGRARNR